MAIRMLTTALFFLATLTAAFAVNCSQRNLCINSAFEKIKQNVKMACSAKADMTKCLDSAKADCQAKGTPLDDNASRILNSAMRNVKKMCPDTEASEGGAKEEVKEELKEEVKPTMTPRMEKVKTTLMPCLPNCQKDKIKLQKLIKENNTTEGCPIYKEENECFLETIKGCEGDEKVTPDSIAKAKKAYEVASKAYENWCGGASAINQTNLLLTVFSAFALIVTRLL